ncbi:DNA repair protein RecO [Melioribacteraceae bacterium 4301-Me]|uniref:DNA repair protein RecO n=1 Tax=Pyranulibacter aquaticus TaxID=3163344 RepID=UPI0035974E80
MSELLKTEAVVLNKINFGDTSKIVHFFTEEYGKLSAILKGARSPKSKIGVALDSFNIVQIVFYKKETRDIQIISQVDLIKHFHKINEDLEKMKYSSAVIELLHNLTAEYEPHKKLYKGTVRILEMINEAKYTPKFLFVKYFIFFIKEIGYEIPYENCTNCGKKLVNEKRISFNLEKGFLCETCRSVSESFFDFTKELFNFFVCLNSKINNVSYEHDDLNKIIFFLEKYLMYHVHEFKGLRSIKLY